MRYRIRHITEYKYADRVSYCYNLAHMTPRSSGRQTCHSSRVEASPIAVSGNLREDYFGNSAFHFEIQKPHRELVITAVSDVETRPQTGDISLDMGLTCAEVLRQMHNPTSGDVLLAREYQLDSAMIKAAPELKAAITSEIGVAMVVARGEYSNSL